MKIPFFLNKNTDNEINTENRLTWTFLIFYYLIYKLGKISIKSGKCGKNMDLLATEILTITHSREFESDFGIYDLSLSCFGDLLFLLLKIIAGELILAENCDF